MNTSFSLRISGSLACFTRPEYKVERFSYPVITPSAARGVLEAILWKPAICWHVDRIAVLRPIEFTSFRRNEVNSRAVTPALATISKGGSHTAYFADEDRAQRNTVALRDVDYRIECHFTMTAKAGLDDNPTKFVEMFRRRLSSGQHFHQPYLGCREFIADVSSVDDSCPPPLAESRDLGVMLWDIVYDSERGNRPIFFHAQINDGVIEVPPDAAAALATLKTLSRGGAR